MPWVWSITVFTLDVCPELVRAGMIISTSMNHTIPCQVMLAWLTMLARHGIATHILKHEYEQNRTELYALCTRIQVQSSMDGRNVDCWQEAKSSGDLGAWHVIQTQLEVCMHNKSVYKKRVYNVYFLCLVLSRFFWTPLDKKTFTVAMQKNWSKQIMTKQLLGRVP